MAAITGMASLSSAPGEARATVRQLIHLRGLRHPRAGRPNSHPTRRSLKIHNNKFSIIRRADAIELNAESDHDILINSDITHDETAAANNFDGFGIAVSGLTDKNAAKSDRFGGASSRTTLLRTPKRRASMPKSPPASKSTTTTLNR